MCEIDDEYLNFTDYHDVWETGATVTYCEGTLIGGEPNDSELEAVEVAYGKGKGSDGLDTLYSICAQTAGYGYDDILNEAQAQEARGAALLCPEHPRIDDLEANISVGVAIGEQDAADREAMAEGKFIEEDGSYLIGSDIVAGTWEITRDRVQDCYWEISDSQGSILDNNFISVAPQFTLNIPASAAGFTTRDCGSWRWVG